MDVGTLARNLSVNALSFAQNLRMREYAPAYLFPFKFLEDMHYRLFCDGEASGGYKK